MESAITLCLGSHHHHQLYTETLGQSAHLFGPLKAAQEFPLLSDLQEHRQGILRGGGLILPVNEPVWKGKEQLVALQAGKLLDSDGRPPLVWLTGLDLLCDPPWGHSFCPCHSHGHGRKDTDSPDSF